MVLAHCPAHTPVRCAGTRSSALPPAAPKSCPTAAVPPQACAFRTPAALSVVCDAEPSPSTPKSARDDDICYQPERTCGCTPLRKTSRMLSLPHASARATCILSSNSPHPRSMPHSASRTRETPLLKTAWKIPPASNTRANERQLALSLISAGNVHVRNQSHRKQ